MHWGKICAQILAECWKSRPAVGSVDIAKAERGVLMRENHMPSKARRTNAARRNVTGGKDERVKALHDEALRAGGPKTIVGALSDDDTTGGKHLLGRTGERLAAACLEQHGLTVLARNWRCSAGELDIIATEGERVVFCEVKTRSGVDYGTPLEAVGPDKVARIRNLARTWLTEQSLTGCPVRFDVVSVLWPPGGPVRIDHLEGVF